MHVQNIAYKCIPLQLGLNEKYKIAENTRRKMCADNFSKLFNDVNEKCWLRAFVEWLKVAEYPMFHIIVEAFGEDVGENA